jgi:hypothetical protein
MHKAMEHVSEYYLFGEKSGPVIEHGAGILARALSVNKHYFNFLSKDGYYHSG